MTQVRDPQQKADQKGRKSTGAPAKDAVKMITSEAVKRRATMAVLLMRN
jgi:hypothetical protein